MLVKSYIRHIGQVTRKNRLMSMMSKLTTQDDSQNKQFKTKTYQGKRRGQARNFYDRHSYDQRNYQNRYKTNSGDRRISFSGRLQYGQNHRDSPTYNQNYINVFGEDILEGIWDQIRVIEDKTIEMDIEEITEVVIMKEVGVGLEKDGFQIMSERTTEVVV